MHSAQYRNETKEPFKTNRQVYREITPSSPQLLSAKEEKGSYKCFPLLPRISQRDRIRQLMKGSQRLLHEKIEAHSVMEASNK